MITRKDVFNEVKSPKQIGSEYPALNEGSFSYIYKAVYMAIRLILDVRSNTQQIKENQKKIAEHLGIVLPEGSTKDGKNDETT